MNAIETKGLTREYKRGFRRPRVKAVDGLNMEVRRGEIFGFLGPNGAGKTSAIRMLMGFTAPTAGDAEILGAPLGDVRTRRRIGFLPEHPALHDFLTGAEALEFYGALHGMGRRAVRERVPALAKTLRLKDELTLPLRRQSKGMVQKLGIAQAMLNDPELLILDEPMSGLDPLGRRDARRLMVAARAAGKTVFFSSHIMSDVEEVCDRVGILVGGRLARVVDAAAHRAGGGAPLEEVFLEEIRRCFPEVDEL